jgi:hypothetical protein
VIIYDTLNLDCHLTNREDIIMKISTKSIAAFSLILLASSYAYAASETSMNEARGLLNSVSIKNNTNKDVVYRMLSSSAANIYYGVKHGRSAKYHTKPGDRHMTFEVGVCKHLNKLTGLCVDFDSITLNNCVGGANYNADHIKSITVNSLTSCAITCDDGGSSSCIAQ